MSDLLIFFWSDKKCGRARKEALSVFNEMGMLLYLQAEFVRLRQGNSDRY